MKNVPVILAILIYFANMAFPGDDFDWRPISKAEWSIREDEERGMQDAVMIFEKIIANDEKLMDEKCYYTIYRRIRILNEQGRSWGDVSIPYLKKDQKIEDIQGRTILPYNTVIPLKQSQILEKEVFKSKELKVRQKSFYLPGVTNDCIIEYMIKFRLKNPSNLWIIAKDIYLIEGEFYWKFFRGDGLSDFSFKFLSDYITPNYIWFYTAKGLNVEMLPSIKNPEEVVFSIADVKAFENEPYTLPDNALRANLRAYYGGAGAPEAFWGEVSKEKYEEVQAFTKNDDKLIDVADLFREVKQTDKKISAAYEWIQKNLKNIEYEDDIEDFKENDNVNDVLEHGYGKGYEINMVFYDLLRELNIDAKMAFVTDRDESIFEKKAKYWQFDHSVVAHREKMNNNYLYFAPCMRFLPMQVLPWYNEGVTAFLVGSIDRQFSSTPFSNSHSNIVKRHISLEINSNFEIKGSIIETLRGHPARQLRLNLHEEKNREQINYMNDWVQENFTGIELDSFELSGLEDINQPLTIKYVIKSNAPWFISCNRVMVQPFQFCSKHENIFHAEKRKFPLVFDYAREIIETLILKLPEEWNIEAIPEDVNWSNKIGSLENTFTSLQAGKVISSQRRIVINSPFIKALDYHLVKDFYNNLNNTQQATVIMKQLNKNNETFGSVNGNYDAVKQK